VDIHIYFRLIAITQHGTDNKITHICVSVCHLSYGCNSHSILIKLCTVVWNPKSKIEFIGGQNPTIPSPTFPQFYTPNALSMARSEHNSFKPCARIMVFDSSKDTSQWPLYWRYTGNSEQCYNSMLFSHKVKCNYSITVQ